MRTRENIKSLLTFIHQAHAPDKLKYQHLEPAASVRSTSADSNYSYETQRRETW